MQQIKDINKVGPVAVRVIGQVTLDGLESTDFKGSYAMGVKSASQVTFEGIGRDATLMCGVGVQNSQDIEIRNLGFMLWGGGVDGDAVTLRRSSAVWIHNNDLFYGLKGPDGDQAKGDGSVDLKDDSKFVTISYNHFWDSGKSSLCGLKKETGPNYITYHHNWFDHSDSRHPRIRTMSVHIYNNFYEGVYSYGVGNTYGGSAFVEANYFKNTRYPMLISRQGSELLEQGYLSSENGGIIKSFGNIMVNQVSWVPYSKNKVEFDSYEVAKKTDTVPATVKAKLGGATYNNFDTDSSVMYTYTPDNAKDVPTLVMSKAGRVNKGDIKFTFTTAEETKKANANLMKQLTSYKTQLVSIGS
jgi:pectate lyase